MYINLNSGWLYKKLPTNDDIWKEGHAVKDSHVFDSIYVFPRPPSRMSKACTNAVTVNCILSSNGECMSYLKGCKMNLHQCETSSHEGENYFEL